MGAYRNETLKKQAESRRKAITDNPANYKQGSKDLTDEAMAQLLTIANWEDNLNRIADSLVVNDKRYSSLPDIDIYNEIQSPTPRSYDEIVKARHEYDLANNQLNKGDYDALVKSVRAVDPRFDNDHPFAKATDADWEDLAGHFGLTEQELRDIVAQKLAERGRKTMEHDRKEMDQEIAEQRKKYADEFSKDPFGGLALSIFAEPLYNQGIKDITNGTGDASYEDALKNPDFYRNVGATIVQNAVDRANPVGYLKLGKNLAKIAPKAGKIADKVGDGLDYVKARTPVLKNSKAIKNSNLQDWGFENQGALRGVGNTVEQALNGALSELSAEAIGTDDIDMGNVGLSALGSGATQSVVDAAATALGGGNKIVNVARNALRGGEGKVDAIVDRTAKELKDINNAKYTFDFAKDKGITEDMAKERLYKHNDAYRNKVDEFNNIENGVREYSKEYENAYEVYMAKAKKDTERWADANGIDKNSKEFAEKLEWNEGEEFAKFTKEWDRPDKYRSHLLDGANNEDEFVGRYLEDRPNELRKTLSTDEDEAFNEAKRIYEGNSNNVVEKYLKNDVRDLASANDAKWGQDSKNGVGRYAPWFIERTNVRSMGNHEETEEDDEPEYVKRAREGISKHVNDTEAVRSTPEAKKTAQAPKKARKNPKVVVEDIVVENESSLPTPIWVKEGRRATWEEQQTPEYHQWNLDQLIHGNNGHFVVGDVFDVG